MLHCVAVGRAAVRACLYLGSAAVLAACGWDSDNPAATALDSSAFTPPAVQISAATTPAFDLSIHDYVIDCTANPAVSLDVTAPVALGFRYVGTSGIADPAPFDTAERFRETFTLTPGQGFRFTLSGRGYSVRCLPPDFPPLTVEVNGAAQSQWYVFSPSIGAATGDYVIVTNSQGTPVWWMGQSSTIYYDAKILGPDTIAWSPNSTVTGQTQDNQDFLVRHFDGTQVARLTGGLNFHELQMTPKGTYLVFRDVKRVCPPDCADMSAWGGTSQEAVIDEEILELDSNSNILWSWSTRDHVGLVETGEGGWYPYVADDIIHMNAIEPDGDDAFLFSGRHLNAIYHVTKSTGAIDWKIGGTARAESLTVVGDPRPTAVNGYQLDSQHDVRKWSDGTVSVHDNGTLMRRPPTLVRYTLDLTARTAEVVQQISDSRVASSSCCGSARLLPGGHWVVQWGAAPLLTELDATGNPIVTINYNMGTTFSYRGVPVSPGVVTADTLRNGMDAMYRK